MVKTPTIMAGVLYPYDVFAYEASNIAVTGGRFSTNASATMISSLTGLSTYGILNQAGFATSDGFSYSMGAKAICVSGTLDVQVHATNVEILYPGPANNYELTEFLTDFSRAGSDLLARSIGAPITIEDTYSIYSKLCVPAAEDEAATHNLTSVHFLTHGGTTDASYWDFAPGYSYIDAAATQGHATFSYDRLGTRHSSHPDPLQVVQAGVQTELAHALIQKLRSGALSNITFPHVIGIGHSLGSAVTQAVSSAYPNDFDALILTGHSGSHGGAMTGFASAAWQIANTLPDREELKNLPNGYFSHAPVRQAMQFPFFYYPHYEEESTSPLRLLMSRVCTLYIHGTNVTTCWQFSSTNSQPGKLMQLEKH
jgi:hypothetical protein